MLPSIPFPARPPVPSPCPLAVPLLGGQPGRRLPRDEGVPDAAVPSGPKPGCARQG